MCRVERLMTKYGQYFQIDGGPRPEPGNGPGEALHGRGKRHTPQVLTEANISQ